MRRSTLGLARLLLSRRRPSLAVSRFTSCRTCSTTATTKPEEAASAATQQRKHPRLLKMLNRELVEEGVRDERPEEPTIPRGWTLEHLPCSAIVKLHRSFLPFGHTTEEQHEIRFCLETKHPEKTFRPDLGERVDPAHVTFHLFVSKRGSSAQGGLEFMLTSVDAELVLDAMTVHSTAEDLSNAKEGMFVPGPRRLRDGKYRGPSVNELDDAFLDEVLDYLDERGINNAFAEYVLAQSHFLEQMEYETFLTVLQQFAR